MDNQSWSLDWRDRKIREWLLILLRFAITRETADRAAVLAMADELDSLNVSWRPSAPTFFARTSSELCDAISGSHNGLDRGVLLRHVTRISDPRLRRAFQGALNLKEGAEVLSARKTAKTNREDLWRGLSRE
jgi:hypothetical protein